MKMLQFIKTSYHDFVYILNVVEQNIPFFLLIFNHAKLFLLNAILTNKNAYSEYILADL